MTMTWPAEPLTESRELSEAIESMNRHVAVLSAFRFAKQERLVRRLLERWVSGLEPAIAMGEGGKILGLCDADCSLGSKPYIFNPFCPRSARVLPGKAASGASHKPFV